MLKIKGINEKLSKIKLEEETKSGILDLIDEKVESDMKEVLNKMDILTNFMAGIKNELKTENQSLRSEIKNETKMVYWVIGIAMAVITVIVTIIGLMIAFKK